MMKKGQILLIGITSVLAAAGITIYFAGKSRKNRMLNRLEKIADEGYETAADILFPTKSSWIKRFRPSNY